MDTFLKTSVMALSLMSFSGSAVVASENIDLSFIEIDVLVKRMMGKPNVLGIGMTSVIPLTDFSFDFHDLTFTYLKIE